MRATLCPACWLSFLFCAAFLAANSLSADTSFAQDKPDRPPWAQKSKGASGAKSQPAAEADDSQDSTPQRGRIRVNVNLVNVLVSVLDEHNRPAPHFPPDSFPPFHKVLHQ